MWPRVTGQALVWALLVIRQVSATYWINSIDDYDSLPVCAEAPLSSIVRDMVSGCGDRGRSTSYSCFCTRSSKEFNSIIATAVAKECSRSGTQVESATSLFHAYCQLGGTASAATATTIEVAISSTARAASTRLDETAAITATGSVSKDKATSINSISSTSSAENSSKPSSSTTISTGSKVAIGICVPISVLAVTGLVFILLRRRRSIGARTNRVVLESRDKSTNQIPWVTMSELSPKGDLQSYPLNNHHFRQELAGGHYFPKAYEKPELDGRAVGNPERKYELE